MRSLWVCLLTVCLPGVLAAQQGVEPGFDPTPLALPQIASGSPRPVTSKDLLALRETHGLSISPDGAWVAFVVGQASYETNSYRTGLFVVRRSAGEIPICLGSAGMPDWDDINEWIDEPPQWSSDSQYVFRRMRTRPEDSWQIWRWNRDGSEGKPLTQEVGDVLKYGLYSSEQKIVMKIELPANTENVKQRLESGILYDARVLPWEGTAALLANLAASERKSELWVRELGSGIERRATDTEQRAFEPDVQEFQRTFDSKAGGEAKHCHIAKVLLAPGGRSAALSCSIDESDASGIMRLRFYFLPGDGSAPKELATDSTRVLDYWWKGDGTKFYYASFRGDGRPAKLSIVDTESGKGYDLFQPEEMLGDFSIDSDGRWIACTRQTNVSPPRLAAIDLRSGTLQTIVDLNPEFRNFQLSAAERISGVNHYGEEWFGHLVKPLGFKTGKRYPLIVTLYRSGDYFLLGAPGNENPIQVYAAHGFVVLSFNIGRNRLRKSGDFGEYFLNWASPAASLEMAVQSLVDAGIVDRNKVGLAGFSHGSEILEYVISHSRCFQAASESGPGARDPFFYYMGGTNWHEIFEKWGLGGWPEGKSRKNWERLAAFLNADQIQTPLLINAADSEFVASMALFTSLEQLHKPVELYIYMNELHVKNQPRHRYEIYERNLDWFNFWLRQEMDPDPGKKEEYVRWEKLERDSNRAEPLAGILSPNKE